jgi:NAD(P)-dependent dehydrogenase (short-subunit alcohol dehydrogenase family)
VSKFFSIPSAPERKDTQTLGTALFNNESFQGKANTIYRTRISVIIYEIGWADVFTINVSSWFFLSTACLGLLEKASKAREAETGGWSSSIIGISSISGQMKQAQDHVSAIRSFESGVIVVMKPLVLLGLTTIS